jgi:hypothetical protein
MKFEYFNPNPDAKTFKSGKPKYWGRDDNSVRALVKVLNSSWTEVFDQLAECAKVQHDMPSAKNVVAEILQKNDFDFTTLGKPVMGQKRPTVEEFVNAHRTGTYVLYLRNYYVTIIDGTLYNTVDMKDESVYSYWTK